MVPIKILFPDSYWKATPEARDKVFALDWRRCAAESRVGVA